MPNVLDLKGKHVLIAGNGPSLASTDLRRLPPDCPVVRINNFFFEPQYYVGRRVDLLQIGGDRWIAPYYLKTVANVHRARIYEMGAWSTHQRHVERRGRQRLRDLDFVPLRYKDKYAEEVVRSLVENHGRFPTTGLLAIINCHALGAEKIILTGFDFYSQDVRYGYPVGPRAGGVINTTAGYNDLFHSAALDFAVLSYLRSRSDTEFLLASEGPTLTEIPIAPIVSDGYPFEQKAQLTEDWAGWAGGVPIALAKTLRRLRELQLKRRRGE